MPYREPIFFRGGYYHIYSRGSEKRLIFLDRADKDRFLKRLEEYKNKHSVSIICYCLMPNHYHLLVKQTTDEPISKFVSRLNLAYAMYFNKRYERVGPLFQGRFKAKNVDKDEYVLHLSRYIHLNPIDITGIDGAAEYPWSSLTYYKDKENSKLIDKDLILSFFNKDNAAQEYLDFVKAEGERKLKLRVEELLFEEISPVQVRGLRRADSR
ncbi:MAG: transposase [Candidatus Curtissbacteria bacterium]